MFRICALKRSVRYTMVCCFTLSFIVCFFSYSCRRDSEDVMELLTMMADDSDFSSDREEEEELEWLYIQVSFCDRREMGQKFNIEECDELKFERLFRSCSVIYVCMYNSLLLCFRYIFKKTDFEAIASSPTSPFKVPL